MPYMKIQTMPDEVQGKKEAVERLLSMAQVEKIKVEGNAVGRGVSWDSHPQIQSEGRVWKLTWRYKQSAKP